MWNPKDIAVQLLEEGLPEGADNARRTRLRIENRSGCALEGGWRLYSSLGLAPKPSDTRVKHLLLDGRYGYLEPGDTWPGIAPGKALSIEIEDLLFRDMPLRARHGFHLLRMNPDGNAEALVNEESLVEEDGVDEKSLVGEESLVGAPTILPPKFLAWEDADNPSIGARSPSADTRLQTPAYTFEKNARLWADSEAQTAAPLLIPAAKKCTTAGDTCVVPGFTPLASDPLIESSTEMNYLKRFLAEEALLIKEGCPIHLSLCPDLATDEYRLTTHQEQIKIEGSDARAIYYAIHSFRQLIAKTDTGCLLRRVSIEDSPGFAHRGLLLDIARHFHVATQIKKTIEVMSAYKMNRLQLGITNDEGWRLEIPSIPELTDIGSRRAYQAESDKDSTKTLYPAWGDGHELYAGYLSTADFIDLLQFADQCHVEIIIEFNLPGHANAIVQSLKHSGRFLLLDPEDQSVHRSAQGYSQNVVNVCLDSTYAFIEVVLKDIKKLYDQANVPMRRIHFGGDEVPAGAWLGSKVCRTSPLWDPAWDTTQAADAQVATGRLMQAYAERITALAERILPGIEIGFWHEMSPHLDEAPIGNSRCYFNAWTTEASGQDASQDLPGALLAREQQLVISNASFLYLDQPYGRHTEEPGLAWAAYIDTDLIYHFDPLNSEQIPPDKQHLLLGLQAQLWTETVFNAELMDYYLFPRLLAVAERCWNILPSTEWQGFARAIGEREFNYLASKGVAFRVPPPGVRIVDGIMTANLIFPGLEIRYSTDGTEPGPDSALYTAPVDLRDVVGKNVAKTLLETPLEEKAIKLRAFTQSGRGSRLVSILPRQRPV